MYMCKCVYLHTYMYVHVCYKIKKLTFFSFYFFSFKKNTECMLLIMYKGEVHINNSLLPPRPRRGYGTLPW